MNDRPTPETDAVSEDIGEIMGCMMVDKELAQKLERERDEAREEVARLKKQIDGLNNFANERLEEIERVRKERDEAREQENIHHDNFLFAQREAFELREAIIATLEENRHLADGDDCTLAKLKSVVPEWK